MARRGPRSDPQKYKVYDWELSFTGWVKPRWTEYEMRALVKRACRMYRVPVPKVVFGKREGMSYWSPSANEIGFIASHMSADVALHEATHAIVDWLLGVEATQDHGPEFVGVYLYLLHQFRVMPAEALGASVTAAKIKFEEPFACAPSNFRKTFAARVGVARRLRRAETLYA